MAHKPSPSKPFRSRKIIRLSGSLATVLMAGVLVTGIGVSQSIAAAPEVIGADGEYRHYIDWVVDEEVNGIPHVLKIGPDGVLYAHAHMMSGGGSNVVGYDIDTGNEEISFRPVAEQANDEDENGYSPEHISGFVRDNTFAWISEWGTLLQFDGADGSAQIARYTLPEGMFYYSNTAGLVLSAEGKLYGLGFFENERVIIEFDPVLEEFQTFETPGINYPGQQNLRLTPAQKLIGEGYGEGMFTMNLDGSGFRHVPYLLDDELLDENNLLDLYNVDVSPTGTIFGLPSWGGAESNRYSVIQVSEIDGTSQIVMPSAAWSQTGFVPEDVRGFAVEGEGERLFFGGHFTTPDEQWAPHVVGFEGLDSPTIAHTNVSVCVGEPVQSVVTTSGNPAPSWFELVGAALPEGLSLNSATGQISGTPAEKSTTEVVIRAANGVTPTLSSPANTATVDIEVTQNDFANTATSITGEAAVGEALTANVDGWSPQPTHVQYQWYQDDEPLVGSTSETYLVTEDNQATELSVRVTGEAACYETRVSSASVEIDSLDPGNIPPETPMPGSGANTPKPEQPLQQTGTDSVVVWVVSGAVLLAVMGVVVALVGLNRKKKNREQELGSHNEESL